MKPYMKIEELADVMGMTPKGVLNSISRAPSRAHLPPRQGACR